VPKNLSFKRLIQSLNLDIIMLQETMCYGAKARNTLEAWLKNWDFCALDTDGMSGGLIMGWGSALKSPLLILLSFTISINLMIKDFGFYFSVLNVYGPYADRIPFWEDLASAGEFIDPLLVVGNDLNFTLSHREIWGESSKLDTQRGFFLSLLSKHHLVDLEPLKLVPTWQTTTQGEKQSLRGWTHFSLQRLWWKNVF
jgi:hypothetical protein